MAGHSAAFDVVGLESPVLDFVVRVDHLPQSNERQRILERVWQGGGKISTGLVAAARMGAVCTILGTVGDDWCAGQVVRELEAAGVETGGLLVRPGIATSMSVILSDRETGGRSILYARDERLNLQPAELDVSRVQCARYFYMSHFEPVNLYAAGIARRCGAKVLMDADNLRPGETVFEHLGLVDYFIASSEMYGHLFGEKPGLHGEAGQRLAKRLEQMQRQNRGLVMFTLGEAGLAGCDEAGCFALPAYPVAVVDTTGAGDVFHGAFLAALVRGLEHRDAARCASAAAAISCTAIGGRTGIPDHEAVCAFMARHPALTPVW